MIFKEQLGIDALLAVLELVAVLYIQLKRSEYPKNLIYAELLKTQDDDPVALFKVLDDVHEAILARIAHLHVFSHIFLASFSGEGELRQTA